MAIKLSDLTYNRISDIHPRTRSFGVMHDWSVGYYKGDDFYELEIEWLDLNNGHDPLAMRIKVYEDSFCLLPVLAPVFAELAEWNRKHPQPEAVAAIFAKHGIRDATEDKS